MLRDQDYDLLVLVSQAIAVIKCVLTLFFFYNYGGKGKRVGAL